MKLNKLHSTNLAVEKVGKFLEDSILVASKKGSRLWCKISRYFHSSELRVQLFSFSICAEVKPVIVPAETVILLKMFFALRVLSIIRKVEFQRTWKSGERFFISRPSAFISAKTIVCTIDDFLTIVVTFLNFHNTVVDIKWTRSTPEIPDSKKGNEKN